MNMSEWAKNEVELVKKVNVDEYMSLCFDAALELYNILCNQGHSGYSVQITKYLFDRLVDGKCLTQIEDTDDIWSYCGDDFGSDPDHNIKVYQCTRMSSLFKEVNTKTGEVKYSDNDRISCHEVHTDSSWHVGFIKKMIDEKHPITMPYMPTTEKFRVSYDSYGPDFGEVDIYVIHHYYDPYGNFFLVDKYYTETTNGIVKITKEEFNKLKETRV